MMGKSNSLRKDKNTLPFSGRLRVALVVPNFTWCDWDINTRWQFIPYNLCLLAAMIEPVCEVVIIDANAKEMNAEEFTAKLSQLKPHVVGITVLMDQYGPAGHYAAKLVKEFDREIKVVMGGVYATINANNIIDDCNIDYVVVGEGEYVFRDLVNYFMGKGSIPNKGIVYHGGEKVINCGHSEIIQDLDSLPLPAYHLIDFSSYVSAFPERRSVDMPLRYPYARIVTSRGCPVGCIFCQVEFISGKRFRGRSPENVLDEIEWLKKTYGVQSLIFDDDNLFINRKRAAAIFQGMIDRGLRMPWVSIATAAYKLDADLIELMKESGCEYIDIAVESGCERVLKIIGKPISLQHAKKVAKKAMKEGIYVAANFVIGFPTETWDEIRETIKFAEDIDVDYVKIFAAMPLPKTKLWHLCAENKCFKYDFSKQSLRWNLGQIETDQFAAGDITILRAYEWDRINFSSPKKRERTAERMKITEQELWKIRKDTLHNAWSSLNTR